MHRYEVHVAKYFAFLHYLKLTLSLHSIVRWLPDQISTYILCQLCLHVVWLDELLVACHQSLSLSILSFHWIGKKPDRERVKCEKYTHIHKMEGDREKEQIEFRFWWCIMVCHEKCQSIQNQSLNSKQTILYTHNRIHITFYEKSINTKYIHAITNRNQFHITILWTVFFSKCFLISSSFFVLTQINGAFESNSERFIAASEMSLTFRNKRCYLWCNCTCERWLWNQWNLTCCALTEYIDIMFEFTTSFRSKLLRINCILYILPRTSSFRLKS